MATFAGAQTHNYSESLACFVGSTLVLGASALQRPDWLPHGLALAEWCANGHREAASGIGPTLCSWDLAELGRAEFANQTAQYARAGWFVPDNGLHRGGGQAPEAVESWYYAYQATGDQYWRDVARAYTLAQNRSERMRAGAGFASLNDVLAPDGGGTGPTRMQSFLLAEVLKYQYLIQTDRKGVWDVLSGVPGSGNHANYFVFNTEAHPLRVAAKSPI